MEDDGPSNLSAFKFEKFVFITDRESEIRSELLIVVIVDIWFYEGLLSFAYETAADVSAHVRVSVFHVVVIVAHMSAIESAGFVSFVNEALLGLLAFEYEPALGFVSCV